MGNKFDFYAVEDKHCGLCGEAMPPRSKFLNCLSCRGMKYGARKQASCKGCGKPVLAVNAAHCPACISARHRSSPAMDEIAEGRDILARWHAVAARRAPAGSAWWWR